LNTSPNPINFIPMTCPGCGGELMISTKQEKAICNYCGKPFLVMKNSSKTEASAENYIRLAKMAQSAQNSKEAYEYFSKALELEAENVIALYGKAQVTGGLSTLEYPRIDEAISYFREAINLCPNDERSVLQKKAAMEIAEMCELFALLSFEYFTKLVEIFSHEMVIYNRFADELQTSWLEFLKNTTFALNRFDTVLNDIKDNPRVDHLLCKLSEICNFITKGVVKYYRMEYDGPIQNFIPVQYLWLEPSIKQKLEERYQKYTSLIRDENM